MLERSELIRSETPLLCEPRFAPRSRRLAFHMRAEVVLLLIGELAVAGRHVRVQRSIAQVVSAPIIARLHRIADLMTFSSKSASPSLSPSGPCGTGAVTAETSDWRMPCSSSALSAAGDVEIDEGSACIDACEFGCTGSGRASDEWRVSPVLFDSVDDAGAVGGTMCVVGMMRVFSRKAVLRRTEISESFEVKVSVREMSG